MARIRTIKPEFWTSEQIVECSPIARLLFIGMWNFADDGGVIPAKPREIKMKVLPDDPLSKEDITQLLEELEGQNLLFRYTVDGKEYYQITGWHNQKIDKPKPRLPGPERADAIRQPVEEELDSSKKESEPPETVSDDSGSCRGIVVECSPLETETETETEGKREQGSTSRRKTNGALLAEFGNLWKHVSKTEQGKPVNWQGNPGTKAEALSAFLKLNPGPETITQIWESVLEHAAAKHAADASKAWLESFKHFSRFLKYERFTQPAPVPEQRSSSHAGVPSANEFSRKVEEGRERIRQRREAQAAQG